MKNLKKQFVWFAILLLSMVVLFRYINVQETQETPNIPEVSKGKVRYFGPNILN